jgi:carboxypeptidase Q
MSKIEEAYPGGRREFRKAPARRDRARTWPCFPSFPAAIPAGALLVGGVLLALGTPSSANAQEPVDPSVTGRIIQEGLRSAEAVAMYTHLANVIGPRLTGSPAFKQAVDWSAQRLRGWGMDNVTVETWDFGRGWTLEGLTLEMTEPRYFPLIGYPEAWTPSTAGEIVATPVYVGDRTADELKRLQPTLAGAIVLATPPQTTFITEDRLQPAASEEPVPIGAPRFIRSAGPVPPRELNMLLQDAGAAVKLQPNQGQHGTLFVTGNRNTTDEAVPSIVLASEHYNMIVRLLEAGEDVQLRVAVKSRYHEDDTNGYNVLAEIPGTDPSVRDEVVMIGAHLDSWHSSPGGSDNADGVASTMEAMRILKALGLQPRRTIRMALWGGEEEGLLGARAWVQRNLAGDENREAREKFYVYLNNDPGYGKILGWYMEENEAAKAVFDACLEPLKEIGALRNVVEGIGSTDHVPFIQAGVPAFNAIQDYRDYDVRTHHTNMDFHERVAEDDLKQAAIVLAVFAWHAAMREGEIPPSPGAG